MKRFIVTLLLIFVAAVGRANDCSITSAVLKPYTHRHSATRAERRYSREAAYRIIMRCPSGPTDARERSIFFQLVEGEFNQTYNPHSEGEEESIFQFQQELQHYLGRIVKASDLPYAPIILRYGDARAMSALGPPVQQDVVALARQGTQTVGYSKRSPRQQAIGALGYWIDEAETRFTTAEKNEMTQLLLFQLQSAAGQPSGEPYAEQVIGALSHADSPDVAAALRAYAQGDRSWLRDAAKKASAAVEARMQ